MVPAKQAANAFNPNSEIKPRMTLMNTDQISVGEQNRGRFFPVRNDVFDSFVPHSLVATPFFQVARPPLAEF